MRILQIVRSSFLRSYSSCLHLLPLLLVPYMFLSTFPSMACFRRQFCARCGQSSNPSFILLYVRCFFLPWLCVRILFIFHRSAQVIFSILFQHHILKLSRYFSSLQVENVETNVSLLPRSAKIMSQILYIIKGYQLSKLIYLLICKMEHCCFSVFVE